MTIGIFFGGVVSTFLTAYIYTTLGNVLDAISSARSHLFEIEEKIGKLKND